MVFDFLLGMIYQVIKERALLFEKDEYYEEEDEIYGSDMR
jgi:hypothetical protein